MSEKETREAIATGLAASLITVLTIVGQFFIIRTALAGGPVSQAFLMVEGMGVMLVVALLLRAKR